MMIKQWIIKIKIKIAIILLKSVQIYYNEYVNDSQMCYNEKKNMDSTLLLSPQSDSILFTEIFLFFDN